MAPQDPHRPPVRSQTAESGATPLARLSLGEVLERVAQRTPAPGGGSSAALGCAVSAALIEMAAGFSRAEDSAELAERAAAARARALALADAELTSYLPVLEALRLPEEQPDRARRIEAASAQAAETPLRIAELGAELAELAAGARASGSPHLAGDCIAATLLAEAASRAASELVAINLETDRTDPRLERARGFAEHAGETRNRVLATARDTGGR